MKKSNVLTRVSVVTTAIIMPYYITTAIDYANGAPHIGHAYEKVLADVIARYRRFKGDEVFFLTGVDQYGQKIQQTAEKEGIHPGTFVKKNTKKFTKLWEKLGLQYDGWAETTNDEHRACVQAVLTELESKGQLYKKGYKGFYSVRQEQFLTDRERNEEGEFGPEWGEVVEIEEENWYFKLSDHAAWLKEVVENDDLKIIPAFRKSEVLNAVERAGEGDLCISRPKERLKWGIELPFDPEFVTYVWFDALINYVSFAGYKKAEGSELPDFKELWTGEVTHVIGKDILVPPHAIYWPCMLHAMGFEKDEMPTLLTHGFWTAEGEKMSKSVGNVIDPNDPAEEFGVDALRYFLMRNIVTGKDSDYTRNRLIAIFNDELANNLGNLLNRSLNMTKKNLGGQVTYTEYDDDLCIQLRESLAAVNKGYIAAMNEYDLTGALEVVNTHVTLCNKFLEEQKPWMLAKEEGTEAQIAAVLRHSAESCAHVAYYLAPFIPESATKILGQLNLELEAVKVSELEWGILTDGHEVSKPKPVFPRIQIEKPD